MGKTAAVHAEHPKICQGLFSVGYLALRADSRWSVGLEVLCNTVVRWNLEKVQSSKMSWGFAIITIITITIDAATLGQGEWWENEGERNDEGKSWRPGVPATENLGRMLDALTYPGSQLPCSRRDRYR